ncbi:uncharacterized protein LOC117587146 [Drosophila guanche]|uniref:uncharacterized protein LOC117587146 n=1 Tax=Drosophila guanche TaxID=7266 RepID=UPI0014723A44|nr:uncharacterized protein LOC117587146 [Drosophila guanche]
MERVGREGRIAPHRIDSEPRDSFVDEGNNSSSLISGSKRVAVAVAVAAAHARVMILWPFYN